MNEIISKRIEVLDTQRERLVEVLATANSNEVSYSTLQMELRSSIADIDVQIAKMLTFVNQD